MDDKKKKINVVGYKSLITIAYFIEEYNKHFNTFVDDSVMKAVREVGISIAKEELIKAIKGERKQYAKGYHRGYKDGRSALAKEILLRIKAGWYRDVNGFTNFLNTLGAAFLDKEICWGEDENED